jgi:hypothetical protein
MSIIGKKKKVFGNIAATKTLTEGIPKLKLSSSFPSINNGGNSILFLTDLIKSLIGYEALVETVVNILTNSLSDIEKEIKKALKLELKSIVSCGVDPSIPVWVKSTSTTGLVIEVNKVDFMDLLKVDPDSIGGKLLYGDSTDFNRFLYDTIQLNGVTNTWNGILEVTFVAVGTGNNPNNTFIIKAAPGYDTKTLTDLNNDFVDSLKLFNSESIINRVIDTIFGSISVSVKKTTKQLENEAKINYVADSIINSDTEDSIDDTYFSFTNDEIYILQQEADFRQKGIVKLECCNKIAASVPVNMLTDLNTELTGATTSQQQKEVISTNLNKMADQTTLNSNNSGDNISIKLNFFQQIIQTLVKAIVGVILSPKIIMVFIINYKIIYGPDASYSDGVDFMKKNKNLIRNITKSISSMIIKILVSIALKNIAQLVAGAAIKRQTEKGKTQLAQLLSLVGIPQESLRIITGLTSK